MQAGVYSNGEKLAKLNGTMALIPVQYIVAKDINITVSHRDTKSHSLVDTLKTDASVGWGPFTCHVGASTSTKNDDKQEVVDT